MTYWKFGGGYSYRTPRSKKVGWSKTLAGVPKSAKGPKTTGANKKKPKSTKTPKKRRKTTAKKKKKSRRGGFRFGNVGIKGMLTGGAALVLAQSVLPPGTGGVYAPAVQKVAAGLAASAIGVGGGSLKAAGLMEAGAILIRGFLGGGIAGFGGGGGGGNGGYML